MNEISATKPRSLFDQLLEKMNDEINQMYESSSIIYTKLKKIMDFSPDDDEMVDKNEKTPDEFTARFLINIQKMNDINKLLIKNVNHLVRIVG